MRALSVCVLLCSALVLTSAAKPGPALFSDWLEKQTTAAAPSSTAKPAASPAYEEADYDWGCFTEKRFGNCRAIGCSDFCDGEDCETAQPCWSTFYAESTLSCCEKREYGDDQPPSLITNLEIGTCEITGFAFNRFDTIPVAGSSVAGVTKGGTFQAVCNLHQGGQCDHPFCDSMVLSWKGTAFATPAVSKTNPAGPEYECERVEDLFPGFELHNIRKSGQKTGKQAGKKAGMGAKRGLKGEVGEVAYYHDPSAATTYYQGRALILSGPATVSSRKYNIKYSTAFIDFTYDWAPDVDGITEVPITVSGAEAANMHMVQPWTYTVRLNKDGKY